MTSRAIMLMCAATTTAATATATASATPSSSPVAAISAKLKLVGPVHNMQQQQQQRRKRRGVVAEALGSISHDATSAALAAEAGADEATPGVPSAAQKAYAVVLKQASLLHSNISDIRLGRRRRRSGDSDSCSEDVALALFPSSQQLLEQAYARCGQICAEYAKTFYLGTLLMTPPRRKAIWAIYVWCRRTDELVDGPNASHITPEALERWQERLEDVFLGRPYDMLDAALSHTVSNFPVDMQPFRDMIEGMRMDLNKFRYKTFDELYLYCYYVAGTVGLMSVPVMGIAPESNATTESVYNAALDLGVANQLTNILRDVGEDAQRGRIYLPQDELAQFGLSEFDIFEGKVTDRWRAFMKHQIKRARTYFDAAEAGVTELDKDSRWPVWASLILYRKILDSIEANDYDNFSKRAYVGKAQKYVTLPFAYARAFLEYKSD